MSLPTIRCSRTPTALPLIGCDALNTVLLNSTKVEVELWQSGVPLVGRLLIADFTAMAFLQHVNRETNAGMDVDVFTLGFARRATTYKRADLLFADSERLKRLAMQVGPLQVVYAGKAPPQDQGGKRSSNVFFRHKKP